MRVNNYVEEEDALGVPGIETGWEFDAVTGVATMTFLPSDPLRGLGPGQTGSIVAYTSPLAPGMSSDVPNVFDVEFLGDFTCPNGFCPVPGGYQPVPLDGDFNADGTVDAADYTIWQDGPSDTTVQADYLLWKSHFGESIASGSGADHVPEPTTLLLALLAMTAVPLRVRCG